MKKLYLLTLFTSCALLLGAQNAVLSYEFQNSLNEKHGIGPALTVLGNPGAYVLDTLNEINGNTRTVYRFEDNSGVQFNNAAAGNFIGSNYSIEIYFVFDELNSWKRVVDWKNRKSDGGAYVYYGQLNFYPVIYSGDAPVVAGEYTYYVVTRNGETGEVVVYTDADEEIRFMDSNELALVDADNVINFFHDDLAVPNEASPGAVSLINLYNYVLDSNTVKQNFENLGGQVFSVKEIRKDNSALSVYPNPASGQATVSLPGFAGQTAEISLFNASGVLVQQLQIAPSDRPQARFNTEALPEGIYMVRAVSESLTASQKLIIRR